MMEQVIPMSWLNKIFLILSLGCAIFCLIIEQWLTVTSLSIYILLIWCIIVIIISTWLSCYILKITLKAVSPFNINPIDNVIKNMLNIKPETSNDTVISPENLLINNEKLSNATEEKKLDGNNEKETKIKASGKIEDIDKIINEINDKFIDNWYSIISDDKTFDEESKEILKTVFEKIYSKILLVNKIKLSHKFADILLLHLKEYRRALRRVEKGKVKNIEEAYRCIHPGSRSNSTLEHTLHSIITIIIREFLPLELTSSLPCKLLLSILAKKLSLILDQVSLPQWIFITIINYIQLSEDPISCKDKDDGVISQSLNTGSTSATAVVIKRQLPKTVLTNDNNPVIEITSPKIVTSCKKTDRISLCLDGLSTIGHKGLWNDLNDVQIDYENSDNCDDDHISPVYEEPTDFATTIARLRNLLQQKSTANSPLPVEEKTFTYDCNQFFNLVIPWTEFHTSTDGSQQLLYCIQFDDVEQHGEDMFETTTATVRRQYVDFVQLHKSLEELPNYSAVMAEIRLPDGGRLEMENYLKTLCLKLSPDTPTQLRHFLRPNNGGSKKADAVAPRFDRLLAKTVTGVFNTLRTVVPGFEMDQEDDGVPMPTLMPLSDIPWRFVEDIKSKNIANELEILLADRVDYCSVDTAYEAVESVEGNCDSELLSHWLKIVNTPYDEELEELDSKLTMTCICIDLVCEILAGIESSNTLRQEAVVRWTKLLFGNITESLINKFILNFYSYIDLMSIFSNQQDDTYNEPIDSVENKLFVILSAKVTRELKLIFGEDDFNKIIKFILQSLECKKVNLDLLLQFVDILASELLMVSKSNNLTT
ncbi:GSCOCG00008174001-RA-CDS [Cotesia congregata]|nr:GSCOCG00008174001-RA-CDS [Cotesia congregata]